MPKTNYLIEWFGSNKNLDRRIESVRATVS